MNTPFHQTIANDFAALGELMENATRFLEGEGVDAQAVYRINLALEEMVTNIIKYGYDEPGRHKIEVTLDVGAKEVALVIVDDGHGFDPVLQERKEPAGDREIGGWGIPLIKKLLHSMDYRRERGRNILEIKTLRQSAAP
ncbi:MAG TPA: ATP-binding protein [Candidatus Methylacidiphilales bacterium]|jgi:anti-sigma regulatory factor (Ser/Thr protein kinase)|nr:ATP-binding protein [Candidatus Methylacidiphilales bacterium]